VGGNIANGSPIGDSPPALIALGATLHLRRGDARRSLPLEDFFLDYRKQDRQPGEFVEAVSFPRQPDRLRCYKLSKRFDQDISAVCGCLQHRREGRKSAIGAHRLWRHGGHPEAGGGGRGGAGRPALDRGDGRSRAARLRAGFHPDDDMRASADYRQEAARRGCCGGTGWRIRARPRGCWRSRHDVHKPLPHDAAPLHVTGQARYVDDIPAPANALHLAFGLSHGRAWPITAMDLSACARRRAWWRC
jgi:hypothetical protein